jgi:hypothetical protein
VTALWVILSIIAWLLVGVAFARRFSVALAENVATAKGLGWFFISLWPLWFLFLLADWITRRMVDFGHLGDRLAAVVQPPEADPTSHARVLEAVAEARAQMSQHLSEAIVGIPFVLEDGQIRPARKAQEGTSDDPES